MNRPFSHVAPIPINSDQTSDQVVFVAGTSIAAQANQFTFDPVTNKETARSLGMSWIGAAVRRSGGLLKLGAVTALSGTTNQHLWETQCPRLVAGVRGLQSPQVLIVPDTNDMPSTSASALTRQQILLSANYLRKTISAVRDANPTTKFVVATAPICPSKLAASFHELTLETRRVCAEFGIEPLNFSEYVTNGGANDWLDTLTIDEVHPYTAAGRDLFADVYLNFIGLGAKKIEGYFPSLQGVATSLTGVGCHENLIRGVFDSTGPSATPTGWATYGADVNTTMTQSRVVDPNANTAAQDYAGMAWRTQLTGGATLSHQRFASGFAGSVPVGTVLNVVGKYKLDTMTNAKFTLMLQSHDTSPWTAIAPINFIVYEQTDVTDGWYQIDETYTMTGAAADSFLFIFSFAGLAPGAAVDARFAQLGIRRLN